MPRMKPPSNAINPTYGRCYVVDEIDVADSDVASLEAEGWSLVLDTVDAVRLSVDVDDAEEQE